MSSYSLVLPPGWVRVALDGRLDERVDALIDIARRGAPKDAPPDQVEPLLRQLRAGLFRQFAEARENGGIDYYLPVTTMHGQLVSATLLVSSMVPDALADESDATRTVAHLLSREGATAVSIDDTIWVRREQVLASEGESAEGLTGGRQTNVREVEYRTFVPAEPRRWIMVHAGTAGDGDPGSDVTGLMVELLDAMMSNWRWVSDAPTDTKAGV